MAKRQAIMKKKRTVKAEDIGPVLRT
jgi:histone H3/H4